MVLTRSNRRPTGGLLAAGLIAAALLAISSRYAAAPPTAVLAFDPVAKPEENAGDLLPDSDSDSDSSYPEEAIIETRDEIRVPFQSRKQILSLGGNGMMGSSVLSKLIERDEYDITLVSRGSWPFDSDVRIKPHVKFIECDRGDRPDDCPDEYDDPEGWAECDDNAWRASCPELVEAVGVSDDYWAVLDFSGYRGEWIRDAVEELGDMVRVYIYVSTDSVYEVSDMDGTEPGTSYYAKTGGRRITEDMEGRPDDEEEAYRLSELDEYGHDKLQGEEVLRWQREERDDDSEDDDDDDDEEDEKWNGFPYVSLRFADVVGPRDGTGRYATYHVWARYAGRVEGIPPFHIDEDVVEATSITYVEDAAQAILKAIDTPSSWDEAYNIASEEVFNVTEMLPTLGEIMGRPPSSLGISKLPDDESFSMFPSVTRGPMDMTKAKDRLGFRPTPLREVLERTAEWYDDMFVRSGEVREEMVEEFVENVLDEDDYDYDDVVKRLWEAIDEDVKEERERRAQMEGMKTGEEL